MDRNAVDYTLDIIGAGPSETELLQRLTGWIANGRVKFHGWQSKEQLYGEFLPNMDCFIHFAHTEGITIAPREAMAHGVVPVISQFAGLHAEQHFVHERNCLTFPVGDFEAAAINIKRLISDPGLFRRLANNALASQTGKYIFAGSMDAWAEAFDRCLEQPSATGATPNLNHPPDGRLTRLGLPPRVAQRVRDLFGRRQIHNDPGSEWPTGSGLMTAETAEEILQFGRDYESGGKIATAGEANVACNRPVGKYDITAERVGRIGLTLL